MGSHATRGENDAGISRSTPLRPNRSIHELIVLTTGLPLPFGVPNTRPDELKSCSNANHTLLWTSTLQPFLLDNTSVSVCFSVPTGSFGTSKGNLIVGYA